MNALAVSLDAGPRDLSKLQVAPIPRAAIPISRILSTVVKAMLQASVVFVFIPGLNGLRFGEGLDLINLLNSPLMFTSSALMVGLGTVLARKALLRG